jgi:hypothetical protein
MVGKIENGFPIVPTSLTLAMMIFAAYWSGSRNRHRVVLVFCGALLLVISLPWGGRALPSPGGPKLTRCLLPI